MKKILSVLILTFCVFAAGAQSYNNNPVATVGATYGNALDTVTNAGSRSTASYTTGSWYYGKTVNAHVIVTKISGTVGGSIGLYGSMDGTNWTVTETVTTATDATNNYFISTTKRYKYYKVMWTGTGTMAASMKSYLLY